MTILDNKPRSYKAEEVAVDSAINQIYFYIFVVRNRMTNKNLDRDPYVIFRDLNAPQSDVRNALILWSGTLESRIGS